MTNAGADPTDGSTVTVTETLPGRADRAGQQPRASAPARRRRRARAGRAPARRRPAARAPTSLAPGRALPADHDDGRRSRATPRRRCTNAPTVAGGGDAGGRDRDRRHPGRRRRVPERLAARRPPNPEGADGCTLLDLEDACTDARRADIRRRPVLSTARRRSPTCARRASRRRSSTSGCGWRPTRSSSASSSPTATRVLGHSYDHPNLNNIPACDAGVRDRRHRGALRRARRAVHASRSCGRRSCRVNAATTAAMAAMGFAVTPNPISRHRLGPGALGGPDPRRDRQRAAPGRRDPAPRRAGRLARRAGDGRRRAADHRRGARARVLLRHRRPRPARSSRPATRLRRSRSRRSPTPSRTSRSPTRARRRRPWAPSRSRCGSPRRHSPGVFVRGETGTITLTVSNPTGHADRRHDHDGHAPDPRRADARSAPPAPAGRARPRPARAPTCSRPARRFPPITIGVRVAATARRGAHHRAARDRPQRQRLDRQRQPTASAPPTPVPGDVGGTVPATLALTLGTRRRSAPSRRASTKRLHGAPRPRP